MRLLLILNFNFQFFNIRFNEFDHKFFAIPEAEADTMDPQQKLLLQCAYRALEDSGTTLENLSGSRTGVYIGAFKSPCHTIKPTATFSPHLSLVIFPLIVSGLMNRDYEKLQSSSSATVTHYSATGTAMSMAANRISFTFHLTGPSFAVDSACSSSLVALHTACQAIKQGAHFLFN